MTAREVVLQGGPPWGFRMHGGVDVQQPLRISRVNPGSKAAHRGVREGDLISSINGYSTRELTNSEAHGLLKSSGDTLRLDLNGDSVGSPKRRQFRTVHQETLQETIKKSSITTYSIQKTVETVKTSPGQTNGNTLSNTNENIDIKDTSKGIAPSQTVISQRSTLSSSSSSPSNPSTIVNEDQPSAISPDNAEASQRSSYTNCTVSPSASTLSEDGVPSGCAIHPPPSNETNSTPNMNDNVSRSKRRRQRRKNRKQNDNQCDNNDSNPPKCDKIVDKDVVESESSITEIKQEYKVDSPGELAKRRQKLSEKPFKSKSLDDDEMLKIQELSETSETEDKENNAIVTEATDSEVENEDTTTSESSRYQMSTLTLTIGECDAQHSSLISPEEESTLRNFLDGLNLVNGPIDAAQQAHDDNAINVKTKKLQRRAALEQYFLPMCQNPRYLDAISEEASDRDSDREQHSTAKHLKQGTPELEEKPPDIPPRLNRERRKKFKSPVEQPPAILVGTKLLEEPEVSEDIICSTMRTAESSTVEVVYISSEGTSPGECDNTSNDSYVLESDKNSSNEEICTKEIVVNGVSSSETDSHNSVEDLHKNGETSSSTESLTKCSEKSDDRTEFDDVARKKNAQNTMVTCRKDNLAQESKTYEELSGKDETLTTSTSSNYNFIVKMNIFQNDGDDSTNILENGIMSQLTPPPTPETLSPKNEVRCDEVITYDNRSDKIKEYLGDTETQNEIDKNKKDAKNNVETNTIFLQNNIKETRETFDKPSEQSSKSYKTFMENSKQATDDKKNFAVQDSYKPFTPKVDIQNSSDASYKKITGIQKPSNSVKEETVYTNALSPPPPSRSPSASSSSSRGSSLCTAKYNPLNSSVADVTSISKEEERSKDALYQPLTLREMCLKFLITLPFGTDILQELADVSLSIDSFTNSLPSTYLPKLIPTLPAFIDSEATNDTSDISVKMSSSKDWVGLPTQKDPQVLVCLSPKQKEELERHRTVPDEAGKLLELHEKFLTRRSYQEDMKKETEEKVTITEVSRGSGSVSVTSPTGNRLLEIIKEEPTAGGEADGNFLYFVEKEPRHEPRDNDNARLNAKNLTEWLNLARGKSMSESNLNTFADIPENNLRKDFNTEPVPRRRTSLPHDIYERQMLYLQEKEREIQRQLEELEEEKRKVSADMATSKQFREEDFRVSRRGDFAEFKNPTPRPASTPSMASEVFRQQMYEEYLDKFAEREERRHNKVIKVTSSKDVSEVRDKPKETVHPIEIEKEFLEKVRQKQMEGKLGKNRESARKEGSADKEKEEDEPVLVMDGEKVKGTKQLPRHLQEFVSITKDVASDPDGIWAPGQKHEPLREIQNRQTDNRRIFQDDEAAPPVWTPKSANSSPTAERKEFRPVNYQSPVLSRKARTKSENLGSITPTTAPPWQIPDYSSDTGGAPFLSKRIPTSHSSPASGFAGFSTSPRLPKAQNPTITLLQKAREGQLPRGAAYIEQEQRQFRPKNDRPPIATPGEVLYSIKNEYTSESDSERPRRMADLGPRKFEGVGPVTKDGMPLILRSETKDQSKWYKRMYDTIHKQRPHRDEYVTVRYKQKRAQYPYASGYLSEPEPGAYDSDFADYRYQTLDRRRPQERSFDYTTSSTMPRSLNNKSSSSDVLRNVQEYKMQPGRIENYTPGHSSISEKEAKEHLEQQKRVPPRSQPRSFINQALKESGYESDSTLVFRRREEAAQQLSPNEQKEAYKVIQKGGDVPLQGLRKPAPERPKESPRKYVENEVTIHYKTPVRQEIKEYLSEDELAYRQAEAMKKIYQEERRKKYLQELQDMNSRRHTDNFIPSQKSPISLNRYDDFDDLAPAVKPRPRSPEPRLVARALYNFVGQTARELTFRKGDLIYVRRQIDKNWYEGELNAMVGLFPTNYVEIVPYDGMKTTPRKAHEGQARAKYNFVAQTHLELSLAKGELVVITRKVDNNWYEGKIGGRKGIFPSSYVEILIDPQDAPQPSNKPVAAPAAHSLLLNGSAGGKESMGSHCYTPSPQNTQLTTSYHAKPVQVTAGGSYGSLNRQTGKMNPMNQALHIETQSEPVPYRALYKYNPQNDDELELLEGDTVYVLEKCDDGWYVGSSARTGAFGTFPGNYVEKI